MKKSYDSPELTVICFEEEDIITTSDIGENELPVMPFNNIYADHY